MYTCVYGNQDLKKGLHVYDTFENSKKFEMCNLGKECSEFSILAEVYTINVKAHLIAPHRTVEWKSYS